MRRIFRFTFPDYHHAPAEFLERALIPFIARGVAVEFFQPEFAAVRGHGAVFTAAVPMPETAVDEDRGFVFGQENIGRHGAALFGTTSYTHPKLLSSRFCQPG